MNNMMANAALPHDGMAQPTLKAEANPQGEMVEVLAAALKIDGIVRDRHEALRRTKAQYEEALGQQTAIWERFGELMRQYRGE